MEIVEENPYGTNGLFLWLEELIIYLMRPFKFSLDLFISCLFLTTEEKRSFLISLPWTLIQLPLSLIAMFVTIPLSVSGFLIWLTFQHHRQPFRLSTNKSLEETFPRDISSQKEYALMTANLCLLPDCFSRFNNLNRTWWRCEKLGTILASNANKFDRQPLKYDHLAQNKTSFSNEASSGNGYLNQNKLLQSCGDEKFDLDVSVLDDMPDVDVLLLQEASWDILYARRLMKSLHISFPYIVYDIGAYSFTGNLFTGNSGLMLASRYRLQTVRFGLFSSSCKQCRFASKGLIMAKVELGFLADGSKAVGYIFNTHLQAFQGTLPVQYQQMTEIKRWTCEFRKSTYREDEVIIFDILGGDFNLDNMSPVDAACQKHPLFSLYRDVGRREAGRDHTWAPGTELRQVMIYHPQISSPSGLKMALQDPSLMRTYILDANILKNTIALRSEMPPKDEEGHVVVSPIGGKRRIDLVLYNAEGPRVILKSYNAVTALSTLTDHIPVLLRFRGHPSPDLGSD